MKNLIQILSKALCRYSILVGIIFGVAAVPAYSATLHSGVTFMPANIYVVKSTQATGSVVGSGTSAEPFKSYPTNGSSLDMAYTVSCHPFGGDESHPCTHSDGYFITTNPGWKIKSYTLESNTGSGSVVLSSLSTAPGANNIADTKEILICSKGTSTCTTSTGFDTLGWLTRPEGITYVNLVYDTYTVNSMQATVGIAGSGTESDPFRAGAISGSMTVAYDVSCVAALGGQCPLDGYFVNNNPGWQIESSIGSSSFVLRNISTVAGLNNVDLSKVTVCSSSEPCLSLDHSTLGNTYVNLISVVAPSISLKPNTTSTNVSCIKSNTVIYSVSSNVPVQVVSGVSVSKSGLSMTNVSASSDCSTKLIDLTAPTPLTCNINVNVNTNTLGSSSGSFNAHLDVKDGLGNTFSYTGAAVSVRVDNAGC